MSPPITYIDGRRLRNAVVAGARHLIARREHLDHINVFPVPDADTGTNMAASARYIVDVLRAANHSTLRGTADAVAEAALMGGRGNSGAILAQFFQGLSEGFGLESQRTTAGVFADAVVNGAISARLAVSEPVEGTILTVMHDWAEAVRDGVRSGLDLINSLDRGLDEAHRSLARTPEQLSILRESNVVDAGAQGFLYLLEGVHKLILHGWTFPEETIEEDEDDDIHLDVSNTKPRYRWCTECLVEGPKVDREAIRVLAGEVGDSVVIAGSAARLRVHVHTDRPGDLFERLGRHGSISREKTDDMLQQYRHANHPSGQRVGIVTDTGCDLPDELLASLNVHQIPFRVSFGTDHYIDKVTLTPERFYDLLGSSPHHPKTAQPTPADFARAYQLVEKHYESILSIHVPGALSGTLQAAKLAASRVSEKIRVVDSNSGSVGIGLLVIVAAEAAQRGCSEGEVLERVQSAIERLVAYFSMDTTDYLVKGGRISKTKGLVGRLLNMRVIFKTTETGEIEVVENLFRGRDPRPVMLDLVSSGVRGQENIILAIGHAAARDKADWYASAFRERLNPTRIIITEFSPALGVHGGPGAISVAALGQG